MRSLRVVPYGVPVKTLSTVVRGLFVGVLGAVLAGLISASMDFEVDLCVLCSRSLSCWDRESCRSLCRPDDRDRSLGVWRLLDGVLDLGGVLVLDRALVLDGVRVLCGDFVLVLEGVLPLF